MLVLSALLCLCTLHVSLCLPSPHELRRTVQDRYPSNYDMKKNRCTFRLPYKDIDWYQRLMPLPTHRRSNADAVAQVTSLMGPAGQDAQVGNACSALGSFCQMTSGLCELLSK